MLVNEGIITPEQLKEINERTVARRRKKGKRVPDDDDVEKDAKPLVKTGSTRKPLYEGVFTTEPVSLNPKLKLYYQVFKDEGLIPDDTKFGEFILGAVETLLEATGRRIAIVKI